MNLENQINFNLEEVDVKPPKEIPAMPTEYLGREETKTEYTLTAPRKWTPQEVAWCEDLKEKGYNSHEIALSVNRTQVSVSIKMKRLGKKNGVYNAKHIDEKYEINKAFMAYLQPKSILDVYTGTKNFYNYLEGSRLITNDINKEIKSDYNMDALKFVCLMYSQSEKFDFIDLDPFGSASESFDLAIKMSKKGIAITLGEIGHKRFKRLDYVNRHYGIETLEEFTTDTLIEKIQQQALKQKKKLVVWEKREWNGISRVWFTIEDYKITEQWKGEKENE